MRNKTLFLIIVIFSTIAPAKKLPAQSDLSINGYIKTDNRLRFDTNEFTWNENRLNLRFEGAPSDKYHFFSEVRLRGLGFPTITQSSDLRVGRQIISWGTADKINPTSNISPDDLEDIFNFGEQLGTNALTATYYLNDNITLTGVFVPIFTPSTLPYGDFSNAFAPTMDMMPGTFPRSFSDKIVLPENKLSESSQYAFKTSTNLFGYDLSFSYFKGRDDLPLVDKVTSTPVDTLGTVNIATELIYPKMQVIGADFAGSIGRVGFWGEGAIFIPDKVELSTFMQTQMGLQPQGTLIALDDKPYFRYVIGGDYTFKNGLYLNAQFLHGFIHERGEENLNDYVAFRFEKKLFNSEGEFLKE
jgi:hypothetical protein